MLVVCSYCGVELGRREPIDDTRISHGICAPCADWLLNRSQGMELSAYLDGFDVPVMIVDSKGRLIACNQQFCDITGRPDRSLIGLLGGEATECRFARLPEGCGHTLHCQTCTIRLCVEHTSATGEPRMRVPASIDQESQTIDVVISTEKKGEVVRLVIEKMSPRERSG